MSAEFERRTNFIGNRRLRYRENLKFRKELISLALVWFYLAVCGFETRSEKPEGIRCTKQRGKSSPRAETRNRTVKTFECLQVMQRQRPRCNFRNVNLQARSYLRGFPTFILDAFRKNILSLSLSL